MIGPRLSLFEPVVSALVDAPLEFTVIARNLEHTS